MISRNRIAQRRVAAAFGSAAAATLLTAVATQAIAGPTIPFGDQRYLTIDYALQAWAQNRGYIAADNAASTTDFFLRRNRLTFYGQANDMLGFYVQIEAGNDGKGGDVDKSTFYRDAYLTLDLSDPVRFIAGRFKNTFSRENLEACLEPLTMDRAEVISYTPFGGSRDTGLAMWGNLMDARFQYRLMVSNGRDGSAVPEKSPRITGRVHVSLLDPEADYGYRGTYLGTKSVFTVGASYDYQRNVVFADWATRSDPKNYTGATVDVFYEQPFATGTYTFSAAVMRYSTGNAINSITADPTLPQNTELRGGYVKAGYMLPNKVGSGRLQFFGRGERLKYHLATGFRDNKWLSGGLHYYIDGQKLKVSFEAARIKFDKQDPTDASLRDYNQATLGLQFIF